MCSCEPRVADLIPARREILKMGGLALAGSFVNQVVWPLQARAAGKANPRRTARYCIFIEMGGAISPMDTWDFKQTRWTPTDLDMVQINDEVSLSRTLFPTLVDRVDEVAFVRSMRAPGADPLQRAVPHPDRPGAERGARPRGSRVRQHHRRRARQGTAGDGQLPDLRQHLSHQGPAPAPSAPASCRPGSRASTWTRLPCSTPSEATWKAAAGCSRSASAC